jgi:hypothetical protein
MQQSRLCRVVALVVPQSDLHRINAYKSLSIKKLMACV